MSQMSSKSLPAIFVRFMVLVSLWFELPDLDRCSLYLNLIAAEFACGALGLVG